MKTFLKISCLFSLLFSVNSFSQMGMGNGGMGGGMGGGMNGGMGGMNGNNGRGMNQMQQPNQAPAKKVDLIALMLDKLTTDLILDTFQATVLKGYLEDAKKKEDLVFAEDIIDQAKMDKIKILRDNLDKKLFSLLSKEQAEKFTKMKEDIKKK